MTGLVMKNLNMETLWEHSTIKESSVLKDPESVQPVTTILLPRLWNTSLGLSHSAVKDVIVVKQILSKTAYILVIIPWYDAKWTLLIT